MHKKATGTPFRSGIGYKKIDSYVYSSLENIRSLNVRLCPACVTTVTVTTDRFSEAQFMMLETLTNPYAVKVDMHMFAHQGMKWASFGDGDNVYSKVRLNEHGTPTTPLSISKCKTRKMNG